MATIKTSDTSYLAETLLQKIASALTSGQEAVDEIYWSAAAFKDGNSQSTSPAGGTRSTTVTESSARIELTETYRDFPDGWDQVYDGRESGTERYTFNGTNLTNSETANATGFAWSDNLTLTGDGLKETDVETGTVKIDFNPQTPGNLTIKEFKHSEKNTYSESDDGIQINGNKSSTLNFIGQAQYAAGETPRESTLTSIRINSFDGGYSYSSKDSNGTSGTGSLALSLRSSTGLTWNGLGQGLEAGSSLDSISYDSKHSGKYDGQSYSYSESYKSGAWSNALVESLSEALSGMQMDFDPEEADDFNFEFDQGAINNFIEEMLAGDDIITGTSLESNFLYGGAGNDTMKGHKGTDDLVGGDGNDKLDGLAGSDYLTGGDGNDILKGGAGDDWLRGDAGNDTLKGDAGDDVLYGGEGNDILDGGAGADRLIGGLGTDTLKGGSGADKFLFHVGESTLEQGSMDTVSDFKIKQGDKLAFDFDFTAEDVTIALGKTDRKASYDELLSAANDSSKKIFVGYTAADKKNGYAFVDTDDNGSMDMAIKLTGITSSNKIDTASFINVSQVDGLFA